MRAFLFALYDEDSLVWEGLQLTYDDKKLLFNTGDPIVDWYQYYKFLYRESNNLGLSSICHSSSIDHWYMDQNIYKERYFDQDVDGMPFVSHKEILKLPLGKEDQLYFRIVATREMKSYYDVEKYYDNWKSKNP